MNRDQNELNEKLPRTHRTRINDVPLDFERSSCCFNLRSSCCFNPFLQTKASHLNCQKWLRFPNHFRKEWSCTYVSGELTGSSPSDRGVLVPGSPGCAAAAETRRSAGDPDDPPDADESFRSPRVMSDSSFFELDCNTTNPLIRCQSAEAQPKCLILIVPPPLMRPGYSP